MITSLVLCGGFILFLLLGAPIAFALAFASLAAIWAMGDIPLMIVPQRLAEGINSFPIMAVPLFLLAGTLMNAGGATTRLVRLAMALVGHIRGGLGHVVIVTNMIMAGMSGSAVADAVGTGSILIPAMKKEGYAPEFAAGLTAAASTIGPVIPPSIPFVVYGVLAEVNVGDLFLAGCVPGFLMGFGLMLFVAFRTRTGDHPPQARAGIALLLRASRNALPALLLPIIIVAGIVGGVFTPTEAAGAAAVYALFLGLFVYRELKFSQLLDIMWEATHTTGIVLLILAAAGIFSWLLTVTQVVDTAQALISAATNRTWVVLMIFNIVLLIMGCFLDTFAVMTIATPMMMPIIRQFGIDPVHFGVVMTVNLVAGALTPPFGMLLYVMGPLAHISFDRIVRAVIPFLMPILIVLVLITYIEWFTLALPSLLRNLLSG